MRCDRPPTHVADRFMNLADILPDADAVIALEPDELGLRILQVLSRWPDHVRQLELGAFTNSVLGATNPPSGPYPANKRGELERGIREAWYWLEGAALLIPHPGYMGAHTLRVLSRRALKLSEDPDPVRRLGARRVSTARLMAASNCRRRWFRSDLAIRPSR